MITVLTFPGEVLPQNADFVRTPLLSQLENFISEPAYMLAGHP